MKSIHVIKVTTYISQFLFRKKNLFLTILNNIIIIKSIYLLKSSSFYPPIPIIILLFHYSSFLSSSISNHHYYYYYYYFSPIFPCIQITIHLPPFPKQSSRFPIREGKRRRGRYKRIRVDLVIRVAREGWYRRVGWFTLVNFFQWWSNMGVGGEDDGKTSYLYRIPGPDLYCCCVRRRRVDLEIK